MTSQDFLNFSTNTQIAAGILAIAFLLLYIAFKVTDSKKKSHRTSK